jgi:uncharacterized coiled-coil protein SlyX
MTPDDLKTFDCTLAREQRDREIADLRDLLAQQAARADGLQAEVDALTDKLIKSGNAKADAKEDAADLRALLAQQAARADAAELKVSQLQSELSEFQFDNGGILSSLAAQTRRADAEKARADQLEKGYRRNVKDQEEALDAALDREARLREALEPFAAMIEQDGSIDTMSMLYRWLVAINHVHVGSEILYASAVYDLSKAAQSALTGGDHEPVG